MSEPIKVGDLVVVLRPGCTSRNVGRVFSVNEIVPMLDPCATCKRYHAGDKRLDLMARPKGEIRGFALYRLKRIPPIEELERDELVKKLTEDLCA